MTAPAYAARLVGVSVRFGQQSVLAGLDLDVPTGCVLALLGENGAGKSTTHALLAGWRRCDAGAVEVLGLPAGSPGLAGRIGAMGQSAPLDPDRSLRAELVRHAHLVGRPDELAARVEALGIGAFLGRRASEVSEGQRRRVELACALLGDPPLLLLDEPTAGLDPLQSDLVHRLIRERPAGQTVVLTTNRLEALDGLADQIVVIHGGRVVLAEPAAGVSIRDRFLAAVAAGAPSTLGA